MIIHSVKSGEFREFDEFTELFSVNQLSELVSGIGKKISLGVEVQTPIHCSVLDIWSRCQIAHVENSRFDAKEHYNAKNTGRRELGQEPHPSGDSMIDSILEVVLIYRHRVRKELADTAVKWKETPVASATGSAAVLK